MKRLRPFSFALVASAALAWTLPVYATGDCNNGKSIYFKKAGGVYISCAQSSCHGAGVNNNNITNGANNPLLIDSQLDNEPQMNNLRGTLNLSFSDIDDIATFLFYYPSACPSGGGTPNLQASPAPVSFPSTAVNATSATTTITITNVGTASALAVTASTPDATHFPLSANTCSNVTVAAGGSCSFKVAFHPTAAGALSNNITVNRTGGALTIGVSGTGSAVAAPGHLSLPSSLSFADQLVGTTSASSTVTISNTGGAAVSVSGVSSSNPSEFTVASSTCTTVSVGASCAIGVTFKPGAAGTRSGSVSVVSNGTGSPQAIGVSGNGTSGGSPPATVAVVEYYNAALDHFFITTVAAEVSLLDTKSAPFQDWSRTGYSFNSYANASAPAASVAICRFFNESFAPKSSHFYAPHGLGCEATITSFPDWKLEDDKLFNEMLPDGSGNCPAGTIPVYRLYNQGMGGAPNHRFVTSLAERQKMINKGYVAEGAGIGVGMCAPQ